MIKKILVLIFILNSCLVYSAELSLSGSIMSDNQKIITSRFMGFIKNVFVSEGDRIKKGKLLYEIDSKEIDSAKSQVELSIEQAKLASQMYKNQYNNVLLNLKRHQRLYKKDMVSKFEVENLELNSQNLKNLLDISKKQISQAEVKLKEVINQYKYLAIKAPNDSVVISKNIKVGEMAMPGIPAIVLSDLSDLKIITEISETDLKYISIGTKVQIEVPSIDLKTDGIVHAIIPSSNPMTHTFRIKIKFNSKDKTVYPGMYSVIKINID